MLEKTKAVCQTIDGLGRNEEPVFRNLPYLKMVDKAGYDDNGVYFGFVILW